MVDVIIKVGYLVQAGGGNLPAGTEGQFLGYGAGGVPVAVDAPAGGGYDDTEVRGLIGAVDDKADANTAAIAAIGDPAWDDVTGKPETFPPATHTHSISQIDTLQATLLGFANEIQENTDALAGKQDAVDIKTINGESIVGTGDIVIPTYDDTAVQDLIAGLEARIAALESGTPSEPETAPTLSGGSLTVA